MKVRIIIKGKFSRTQLPVHYKNKPASTTVRYVFRHIERTAVQNIQGRKWKFIFLKDIFTKFSVLMASKVAQKFSNIARNYEYYNQLLFRYLFYYKIISCSKKLYFYFISQMLNYKILLYQFSFVLKIV